MQGGGSAQQAASRQQHAGDVAACAARPDLGAKACGTQPRESGPGTQERACAVAVRAVTLEEICARLAMLISTPPAGSEMPDTWWPVPRAETLRPWSAAKLHRSQHVADPGRRDDVPVRERGSVSRACAQQSLSCCQAGCRSAACLSKNHLSQTVGIGRERHVGTGNMTARLAMHCVGQPQLATRQG